MEPGKWDLHRLSQPDGIKVAQLTGAADLWGLGRLQHAPRSEAIAAIHQVSADATLLGIAAGYHLASDAWKHAAAELLREAGADWDIAGERAAEIRDRLGRHRHRHTS